MVSVKSISLSVLVVQTSVHVLMVRYSRTITVDGTIYLPSTVVVLSELIKVLLCILVLYYQHAFGFRQLCCHLNSNIVQKSTETVKLIVPSGLYVVQNNFLYVALTTLDAATYQITYQMKILTTAIFAVLLLGKKLTAIKWLSLLLLMIGVAMIQLPNGSMNGTQDVPMTSEKMLSILCVLAACFSSGFAGIYFEKLLKGSLQSVWIRNIQLGGFGVVFGLINVFIYDHQLIKQKGFLQGYSWITWIVILLQAFGGLTVSLVIKYADNILKSFAASISIIFSTAFSYYIFNDLSLSSYFVFGAAVVIAASFLYGLSPRSSQTVAIRPKSFNV